jgi:hypothetical protein
MVPLRPAVLLIQKYVQFEDLTDPLWTEQRAQTTL